jgi:hypothetical protein
MTAGLQRKEVIAIVLAALSLLVLSLALFTVPPRVDGKLHADIGHALAAETLKALGPGNKVTIITRDTDAFPQPALDRLLAALERDLRRAGKEIRSVEHIQLDSIRPVEVPSGDFYELLRRLPAGDVVVSLLGPPLLLPEHQEKLGRPKARVIALCIGRLGGKVEEFFQAGLLQAAVVNKPTPVGRSFNQLYDVIRSGAE